MKKSNLFVILILASILIPGILAIPQTLNLHGKLTDSSGNVLNGTYNMTFRIYDVSTGSSSLWEFTNQTISVNSDGTYHIILSNVNLTFAEPTYLGIQVGDDSEMTPRINLTSTPYSFRTNITDYLDSSRNYEMQNLTLGNKITFAFNEVIDNVIDGWIRITGGLNVTENLEVVKNFTVDTDTLFVDSDNNRVGIGTNSPSTLLELYSNNSGIPGIETTYYQNSSSPANSDVIGRFNFYGKNITGDKILYGYLDGAINSASTGRGKFVMNLRTTGGAYKQHVFTDTSINLVDGLIYTSSVKPFVVLGNIASGQAGQTVRVASTNVNSAGISGFLQVTGTYSGSGTAGLSALNLNPTMTSGGSGGWKMLEINPNADVGTGNKYLIWAGINDTGKFVVDESGNVGIGTTTPQNKLNVIGNTNITGNLTLGAGAISFNDSSKRYDYYNGSTWKDMSMGNVPAGAIMAFNSATCPTGWILADGTSGTPDLRGRTIIGTGNGTDINSLSKTFTFNETGGEYNHTLTIAEMPSHRHNQRYGSGSPQGYATPMVNVDNFDVGGTNTNTGYTGGGASHSVIQPYRTLTYCMKTSEDSETSNTIWGSSGDNVFVQNTSKNVGIGTTSPSTKLEVNGSANITGGIVTDNVVLKTKVIEIGDWNMDNTSWIDIAHGLNDFKKIRSVSVVVRNDDNSQYYDLISPINGANAAGINMITSTIVRLVRNDAGYYDATFFNSISYNRGWITITYEA